MTHISFTDPTYGPVPLCGRANWDELVPDWSRHNECWECASIAGVQQPSERNDHADETAT